MGGTAGRTYRRLLYKLASTDTPIIRPCTLKSYCNMLRLVFLGVLCVGSFGFVARPKLPDHRIVGGVTTSIAQHPHQVSLRVYNRHNCGGSIISNKWIITAGHCVDSGSALAYTISVGSTDNTKGVIYNVKRTVRHPQFDPYTIDYDIALVELTVPLALNSFTSPIKLPTAEPPANKTVNITGWGAVTEGGPSSNQLLQVSVPIVDRKVCAKAYEYVNDITTRMICAGVPRGGKDACQGDSGGPLTANKTLYGVVSWGLGCGQPNYPGVYGNVAGMRPWIRNITGI